MQRSSRDPVRNALTSNYSDPPIRIPRPDSRDRQSAPNTRPSVRYTWASVRYAWAIVRVRRTIAQVYDTLGLLFECAEQWRIPFPASCRELYCSGTRPSFSPQRPPRKDSGCTLNPAPASPAPGSRQCCQCWRFSDAKPPRRAGSRGGRTRPTCCTPIQTWCMRLHQVPPRRDST